MRAHVSHSIFLFILLTQQFLTQVLTQVTLPLGTDGAPNMTHESAESAESAVRPGPVAVSLKVSGGKGPVALSLKVSGGSVLATNLKATKAVAAPAPAFVQVVAAGSTTIMVSEELHQEFLTDQGEVYSQSGSPTLHSVQELLEQHLLKASWTADTVFLLKWRGATKGAYVALASALKPGVSNQVEWEESMSHQIQGDCILYAGDPFREGGRFLAGMMIVCMDAEARESMEDEIGTLDLSDWVFLLKKPNIMKKVNSVHADMSAEALGLNVAGGSTVVSVRSKVPQDDHVFATSGAATGFMHKLFQPATGSIALHHLPSAGLRSRALKRRWAESSSTAFYQTRPSSSTAFSELASPPPSARLELAQFDGSAFNGSAVISDSGGGMASKGAVSLAPIKLRASQYKQAGDDAAEGETAEEWEDSGGGMPSKGAVSLAPIKPGASQYKQAGDDAAEGETAEEWEDSGGGGMPSKGAVSLAPIKPGASQYKDDEAAEDGMAEDEAPEEAEETPKAAEAAKAASTGISFTPPPEVSAHPLGFILTSSGRRGVVVGYSPGPRSRRAGAEAFYYECRPVDDDGRGRTRRVAASEVQIAESKEQLEKRLQELRNRETVQSRREKAAEAASARKAEKAEKEKVKKEAENEKAEKAEMAKAEKAERAKEAAAVRAAKKEAALAVTTAKKDADKEIARMKKVLEDSMKEQVEASVRAQKLAEGEAKREQQRASRAEREKSKAESEKSKAESEVKKLQKDMEERRPPPPPVPLVAHSPWLEGTTPTGAVYYYHSETHETRWSLPGATPVLPGTAPSAPATPTAAAARAAAVRIAQLREEERFSEERRSRKRRVALAGLEAEHSWM